MSRRCRARWRAPRYAPRRKSARRRRQRHAGADRRAATIKPSWSAAAAKSDAASGLSPMVISTRSGAVAQAACSEPRLRHRSIVPARPHRHGRSQGRCRRPPSHRASDARRCASRADARWRRRRIVDRRSAMAARNAPVPRRRERRAPARHAAVLPPRRATAGPPRRRAPARCAEIGRTAYRHRQCRHEADAVIHRLRADANIGGKACEIERTAAVDRNRDFGASLAAIDRCASALAQISGERARHREALRHQVPQADCSERERRPAPQYQARQ